MRYFSILTLFLSCISFGQGFPNVANDPSWQLNDGLSDEFNSEYSPGVVYNPTKWKYQVPDRACENEACISGDQNHVSISSDLGTTYLRLTATQTDKNCTCMWDDPVVYSKDYTVGNLTGENEQQYGFFEIRMRIADQPDPGKTFEGLAANAWLWRSHEPYNAIWSEIDLAEINANGNYHTCNVIFDPNEDDAIPSQENMRCGDNNLWGSIDCERPDFYLSAGWHTYQVLWTPDYIKLYHDATLINQTTLGCPGMEPLNWIVGIGVGTEGQFNTNMQTNTQVPYNLDVDYIRTYTLNMDCNTIINQCNWDPDNYDNKVKKSITFGGSSSSCINSIDSNPGVYLKATDHIQIDGNFTVPLGKEFAAEIFTCTD